MRASELAESGPLEGHATTGHPSVSNRVQDPACFTLPDWSPTEDLHLTSPVYKTGAPLPVRDGQIGGPPRNRTWITPLKRRVSVSLS
jgi:hypothetical protein